MSTLLNIILHIELNNRGAGSFANQRYLGEDLKAKVADA